MTDDEQAIRDLVATWQRASAMGDLATVLTLMADDVVFLVPGREPIRGKAEFEALSRSASKSFRVEGRSEFGEIAVHGDWGYFWTRLAVTMSPLGGGETLRRAGHTLTIVRREPDGRWVLARDANLLMPA